MRIEAENCERNRLVATRLTFSSRFAIGTEGPLFLDTKEDRTEVAKIAEAEKLQHRLHPRGGLHPLQDRVQDRARMEQQLARG